MARITTAQQPHLFAPSSDTVFWIPFVPPSRARTSSFFALPERRWGEKKSSGWRRGGGGRMALWYMVPAALASEGARFARLPAGGVSALAPAPSIKLGCVLDASTCRLKKCEKAVEVKGPIPQGRSKVYRVFCSASARERPARRRRAGRNRRRRRIS